MRRFRLAELFELAQACAPADFASQLLARLAALADADRGILVDYSTLPTFDLASSARAATEPVARYQFEGDDVRVFEQVQAHVPRVLGDLGRVFAALTVSGLYRDCDVFSRKERVTLPLYCEIVIPQRVVSTIVVWLPFRNRPIAMLRLERVGRRRAFPARVVEALQRLRAPMGVCWAAVANATCENAAVQLLSPREREVAELITKGLRTREIAALLGTSRHTVGNQVSRMFAALDVSNRAELVAKLKQ